jgi:hypothetical protein
VTCYTQPCKPCRVVHIMHYLPRGDESSPRGRWGICAPALPEVLTLGFQIMGQGPVINLLTYFDIPPNMSVGIQDDLKDTTEGDLNNLDTKLYKLKALKTKLRNCLTCSFGDHIEESTPHSFFYQSECF